MNKVGIAAAVGVVALSAAYVGASWYTGKVYDEQLQFQLQSLNQQPGIKAQWQPSSGSLWSRDGVLQLTLAPEFTDQYVAGMSREPVELFLQLEQSIQPLYVHGSAHLDGARGSLAPLLQKLKLEFPHQLNWQVNALTQSFAADVRLDPWKLQLPDDKIDFALLKLQVKGTIDQQADVQLEWDGLSAGNESRQLIYVAPVRATFQLQNHEGLWLSPDYRLDVAGVRYISPEQSLILQQLKGQGSMLELASDSGMRLNLHFDSKLQSLEMMGAQSNFSVENLDLGVNLLDIDKQGYLTLLRSSSQSNLGQMAALAAMQQITSKGMGLQLDTLSLDYNKANLQAKGHVTLSADPRPILGMPQLLERLQAQMDLSATPELVAQLPNGPAMVKPMVSRGYIKQGADGKLSSQLKLMAGKASANGVALPL